MKVAKVDPFVVPYVEPNDHGSTRYVCLVRVESDTGVVGWGEGVTLFREASFATAALIDGWRELLVGLDASPTATGRAIRERAWWYGEGGICSFALSAIDIAMWALQGRAQELPLIQLLGGAAHSSLPTLTSSHATLADLENQALVVKGWVDKAQSIGIKIAFGKNGDADLGRDPLRDVRCIALIREALGPRPRIMVDIGARVNWTVEAAIGRARSFEPYDVDWLEEPLGADNPPGYEALKAATTIPIAYGEREWTVAGVARIVSTGTVDVVGVDPGRCEGITGFRDAARLVAENGAQINAHAFAGPITYAAALALSLASPSCRQLEVPPSLNELYEIVGLPVRPEDGRVRVLHGAGLGFDVDEAAVRRAAQHSESH